MQWTSSGCSVRPRDIHLAGVQRELEAALQPRPDNLHASARGRLSSPPGQVSGDPGSKVCLARAPGWISAEEGGGPVPLESCHWALETAPKLQPSAAQRSAVCLAAPSSSSPSYGNNIGPHKRSRFLFQIMK